MKVCENCGNGHDGEYGSGRFCSAKCARGFSTKAKRKEINKELKRQNEKRHPKIIKYCGWCGEEMKVNACHVSHKTCSISCGSKLRNSTPEAKERLSKHFSKLAKARYASGDTTIGWQSRKNMKMSRPEKFSYDWLSEKKLNFEREYKLGKYFIDFAFIKEKVALEIDGKQHTYPERIISDKEKDDFLRSQGWEIIRIKFYGFNNLKEIKKEIYDNLETKNIM